MNYLRIPIPTPASATSLGHEIGRRYYYTSACYVKIRVRFPLVWLPILHKRAPAGTLTRGNLYPQEPVRGNPSGETHTRGSRSHESPCLRKPPVPGDNVPGETCTGKHVWGQPYWGNLVCVSLHFEIRPGDVRAACAKVARACVGVARVMRKDLIG